VLDDLLVKVSGGAPVKDLVADDREEDADAGEEPQLRDGLAERLRVPSRGRRDRVGPE